MEDQLRIDNLEDEISALKTELRKRWERIERLGKEVEDYKEDNTNLVKLLFLHRRFHNKVGCPGEDECYVCKEDNE